MNTKNLDKVPLLWKPDERYGTVIKKFGKIIQDKYNIKIDSYWDLYDWSIDHIEELWAEIWDFSGIICSKKFDKVVDLSVPLENTPLWFEGAKLNLAENLLKYRDDKVALILAGEGRETEKLTFSQLYKEAELYAAALRKFGLQKGDVVVCQMSNRKEAVICMIAVTSIGAIWTGALPLLGSKAVLNRFKLVEPKIFLTIDQIPNNGENINMLPKIKEIADGLPSLEKVIIVASKKESHSKDISGIETDHNNLTGYLNSADKTNLLQVSLQLCFLDEFLQLGRETDGSVPPIQFEQVSCSHPIFINYTSGTTGPPKALVHGFGYLLATFRDFSMHNDADRDRDSIWFSMSPVGWATWNCFKEKYVPTEKHKFEFLKVLFSGSSVVKPESFEFAYKEVKKDIPFASLFGATEFVGSAITFEASLPVYIGELNAFSLGVNIETLDEEGKPVHGEVGEVVLTKPMPNLPLGLWRDKDNSVYREKYFAKYPGKFNLSDYGIINPFTRGIMICCRSDDTLKQRGCRFGSSEIYSIVNTISGVIDSLCVSQYNKNKDERAVLFLKMKSDYSFNDKLVNDIRVAITQELTPDHVPDVILEIKDIPFNLNSKKMEIVVKKIINKMPYNDEMVINPESLKHFHEIPELQGF
ncbi:acetoacetyl-CoA synthetase [Caerostris extrusa]|uniref:Acetoacetyl-CoA synthetase n=1 Tax=Caerostris extrusa TaxID=172846 RepID=A0AAV4V3N4_CAEEX|nr:acetoacetyl-CoA synthetase [Caerostris extrusa]